MNTGVYLLYKAHIRLLCCAVMPNPHRLSVGVSWVWPARRGRSSRLALPLGASPIGCSPIIIRPSRTRSPSFRCHSGAVAHSDVQGKHRVLRKHTHTHTCARRDDVFTKRHKPKVFHVKPAPRRIIPVTIDHLRRDGRLTRSHLLHFCFFIFNAFLWLMFCRNYDHYCSCFL